MTTKPAKKTKTPTKPQAAPTRTPKAAEAEGSPKPTTIDASTGTELTIKPPKPPRKGSMTDQIIKLREANPTLSERQTAELVGCSKTNVHLVFERYGINSKTTEDFRTHRADILAGLQDRILKSLTDEALKKTPAIQLITAAGILFDKERLERNQSTGNYSVIVGALQDLQRMRNDDQS
jgi:hypothetical protein